MSDICVDSGKINSVAGTLNEEVGVEHWILPGLLEDSPRSRYKLPSYQGWKFDIGALQHHYILTFVPTPRTKLITSIRRRSLMTATICAVGDVKMKLIQA
jgi:hypothetical protein